MRKGTKKIRKVCTGTGEYYIYDLDEDAFGKRKRIYGKTEGEVRQKVEAAMQERKMAVSAYKPKTKKLSDYVTYYFKNAIGKIPSADIKRFIALFERAVFGSELDRDMDTISETDMQEFYEALVEKFPLVSVQEIDTILQKTFEISNAEGITNLSFENVKIPTDKEVKTTVDYILTPEEFEDMLSFCISDNCTRYGKNELIITFSMLTGLKFPDLKTLKNGDIDLENGAFTCKGRSIPMTERCTAWLKQCADLGLLLTTEATDDSAGISRYTCDKDALLFVNSNGVSPTIQSICYTIVSITKRCGLPKGISGKTLCKSYVVSELEHGTSAGELCQRLGYKTQRQIIDIKDEYEVRKKLF